MAGMQETDHITLKNGITYLLQDAKARAQLADLLVEVMEKYGADNPPPYPVTSVNGQTGDVEVSGVDLPVSVQDGGTGATSAATARANLAVPNMQTESFPALLPPDGSNNWIKIGKENSLYGLLPSQAGSHGSGHNYLGANAWYWDSAFVDHYYGSWAGDTIPVDKGGTGADNAAGARTNLGLGNAATENVVPLNKGGTGATTAADARENLAVLPLAGGTLTGKVTNTYADVGIVAQHGTANKDAGFRAERTDTGVSALFGVGSGGVNHGIYSYKLGKWMIYGDGSNVYCNGTATNVTGTVAVDHGGTGATTAAAARTNLGAVDKSGDTMTGNLTVQKQGEANIYANNTKSGEAHKISLCAGSSGIGGVWDATLSKWLIALDRGGFFYCADRVSQSGGELSRLVSNGQMWLCIGMRYSAAESIVVLAHMYSGTMYTNTIYKTANMAVLTNNQGTVSLRYGGSPAAVLTCAIRLY